MVLSVFLFAKCCVSTDCLFIMINQCDDLYYGVMFYCYAVPWCVSWCVCHGVCVMVCVAVLE